MKTLFFRVLRKRRWLIVLCVGLAVGGVALVDALYPPEKLYTARVILHPMYAYTDPSPCDDGIGSDSCPVEMMGARLTDPAILQAAIEAGEFELSASQLADMVSSSVTENSSTMILTVTYSDPVLAVEIADMIAVQSSEMVEDVLFPLTPEQSHRIELMEAEIDRLRERIDSARERLIEVSRSLESEIDPVELDRLNDEYDILLAQIHEAARMVAAISPTYVELEERICCFIDIQGHAYLVNHEPMRHRSLRTAFVSALAGRALGFGIALRLEVRAMLVARAPAAPD